MGYKIGTSGMSSGPRSLGRAVPRGERQAPRVPLHAVDEDTGQPACGTTTPLMVLDADWESTNLGRCFKCVQALETQS
jgi:hypothetical protein